MIDPVPGIIFRTAAITGSAGAAAAVFLARWAERRKAEERAARHAILVAAIVLLGLAGAGVVMGAYEIAQWEEERHRFTFRYSALLEPNGTGEARVSLPMLDDEHFLTAMRAVPASASLTVNQSGAEPALDVLVTGPTWVNASFSRIRASGEGMLVDLTRTSEEVWCEDCLSEFAMAVTSGGIHDVRVRLTSSFGYLCYGSVFRIDVLVLPGVDMYPGDWVTWAC